MKKIALFSILFASQVAMAHGDALQPQSFESKYNFDQTITVLTDTLTKKGMTIFAKIDHQKAAKDAGLTMQPATVIIYGAPKVGTPLMVKDPSLALQLPLKVLVTEAEQGEVKVLLNTAEQVVSHSKTPYSAVENSLAKAEKLIKATVSK
nr:DUF302 domain-containing protein [Histophilus somni]